MPVVEKVPQWKYNYYALYEIYENLGLFPQHIAPDIGRVIRPDELL